MKRQSTLLIAVLAACAIFATACSKTTTNTNNANTSTNTSSKATNTTTTSSTQASGSPTAVTQASFDAFKKKDVAGFKKTLSSADLKSLEEVMATAKDGKNVDDFLKELMESPDSSMPDTFETRNEKIDGDKATVQYKDKDGGWKTMYLVKEGSEWKMKMGGEDENPPAKKESGGMDDTGHK